MAAMATDIGANPAFLLALQSMLDSATRRGYGQGHGRDVRGLLTSGPRRDGVHHRRAGTIAGTGTGTGRGSRVARIGFGG